VPPPRAICDLLGVICPPMETVVIAETPLARAGMENIARRAERECDTNRSLANRPIPDYAFLRKIVSPFIDPIS
jgi:hypothetical protein